MASNASRRGTYSKKLSSFMAFLFKLERYMDRHAPRMTPAGRKSRVGWKCMPKFVQSQWELEMEEAAGETTTTRRDAFTPIVDNVAGTVTVPYAAVSVSGVRTQWCYAEDYYVVEEGMNDPSGTGVFVHELEEKLNGRDDYGLMWFTLTGTVTARGYPTMLIIFERRSGGTHVYFHRVHPSRKRGLKLRDQSTKRGATPASWLIRECYRYMAGNVTVDQIAFQQGDLMFIEVDGPGRAVAAPRPCYGFEGHMFVSTDASKPVKFIESMAKSPTNRLCYLHAEVPWHLEHGEHEHHRDRKAGWFEVRRVKSFSATPVGIWSLTID
jgi:hypothetical protein